MNIFIWMFISYIPFLWYWIKVAIKQMSETEVDKVRRHKRKKHSHKKYWGE